MAILPTYCSTILRLLFNHSSTIFPLSAPSNYSRSPRPARLAPQLQQMRRRPPSSKHGWNLHKLTILFIYHQPSEMRQQCRHTQHENPTSRETAYWETAYREPRSSAKSETSRTSIMVISRRFHTSPLFRVFFYPSTGLRPSFHFGYSSNYTSLHQSNTLEILSRQQGVVRTLARSHRRRHSPFLSSFLAIFPYVLGHSLASSSHP